MTNSSKAVLILLNRSQIKPHQGYCYVYDLPVDTPSGDSEHGSYSSLPSCSKMVSHCNQRTYLTTLFGVRAADGFRTERAALFFRRATTRSHI